MANGEITAMREEVFPSILILSWLFVFSRRVRRAVVVNAFDIQGLKLKGKAPGS